MRKRSLRRRHRIASHICAEKRKKILSPAGNRTPVFRVTGGDTHHYTTEDRYQGECVKAYLRKISQFEKGEQKKKMFPCGESNPGRGGESAES